MRIPEPAALLVEHPSLPAPRLAPFVAEESGATGRAVSATSLSRRDRFRAAVQLTAAASLLSDFDLWPGRTAFAGLRLHRCEEGARAVLGRFPCSLSLLLDRLGGGEGAMEAARAAVIDRVARATGLPPGELDGDRAEPGLSLEGALGRQLRELGGSLDSLTARTLWALRWDPLPLPADGDLRLWRVPFEETARRLAAALWCALRRRGRSAWVEAADEPGADRRWARTPEEKGALIVVGRLSHGELNALARWAQREGCSATAVGLLPRGWAAEPPPTVAGISPRNLAITGVPPAVAQELIDARQQRFEPFEAADRGALTNALLRRLAPAPRRRPPGGAAAGGDRPILQSWLALAPDGLPPGFLALHTALAPADLELQRRILGVVESDGRWRLPEPRALVTDSRHLLIAALHAPASPQRLLHEALGSGNAEELESWARGSLDRLESAVVRELLAELAGGALGERIQLLLAEACLAVLDLAGARTALAGVAPARRGALTAWLENLDPAPGVARRLPAVDEVGAQPRAAAEAAALALVGVRCNPDADRTPARAVLEACRPGLGELVARRIEIDLFFVDPPGREPGTDGARALAGRHTALRIRAAHREALARLDRGDAFAARRLLRVLARNPLGPGLRGMLELDLGAAALALGESREAVRHDLLAYQLLRAAGFAHLISGPLFNLAVADVDQLRVEQAAERLGRLLELDASDPFAKGELARLALAVGDEVAFRRRLEDFSRTVASGDARFDEGLSLLRGAAALLDGDPRRAEELLRRAGQEGEAWLALSVAAAGGRPPVAPSDGWGVAQAAALLTSCSGGGPAAAEAVEADVETPGGALAVVLAERVGGRRLPLEPERRRHAARTLRAAGLVGWADTCDGVAGRAGEVFTVLARVVERGGIDGAEPEQLATLLAALGVSGLEIRDGSDRSLLWRHGVGSPGPEMRQGRLLVTPLGGELGEGPVRHLVLGILDLVLPRGRVSTSDEVDDTGFAGVSEPAEWLRRELRELGPTHLPILLLGETGVGKEVAARALHRLSGRSGAFVAVNIAAIPGSLLEAELFGSVKGAFTGADRSRLGLAVAADGGTLFLDEIGDLDPGLQVKLLRFIESGEVRAVGAHQARRVDVRIVSATHRDLKLRMRDGAFRRDLFFRIAAPDVLIPPLRERSEDIPLLRTLFEGEACARHGLQRPSWSAEAEGALCRYPWPGNVRELRQVVEVAMVRARGGVVRPEHLPCAGEEAAPAATWEQAQQDFRRRFLAAALRRHRGNRSAAARELGISRQVLLYHIRNLGLKDLEDEG